MRRKAWKTAVVAFSLAGLASACACNPPRFWTRSRSLGRSLQDPIAPEFVRDFTDGTFMRPLPRAFVDSMIEDAFKVPARVWRDTFAGLVPFELNRLDLDEGGRGPRSPPDLVVPWPVYP